MGDPISPGMTIGACAWMEQQWQMTIADTDKLNYTAARYMDDILMIYAKAPRWDHERFLQDFDKSECYHPPLKLEDAKDDTFLETTFELKNNQFRFWLKNDNTRTTKIWRYQHFASASAFTQKRATLVACMRKVQSMASDKRALVESATIKLQEFAKLRYPTSVLRGACTFLAATTGTYEWIQVRQKVDMWN